MSKVTETLSIYKTGLSDQLMMSDSGIDGILRYMTLEQIEVMDYIGDPDWGETFYKMDIPPDTYPALVKRLQGRFVIVLVDSGNFLSWWSFDMDHYWDEAWAEFMVRFKDEDEDED